MKKTSKVIMAVLAAAMAFALTACGGGGAKGTEASGDMITATIPSGWTLVSGADMQGIKTEDFICHAKEYKVGDPYLQVEQEAAVLTP